ncbi:hypothetical protein, partial [Candidatus Symbiopectobacterium sp. NZEC135]|uniref:hypothetical protein n=1 Tax=Candidatus Symbiopectobacterium sp. NZEC135 TaxID=2820471 RepID=UPI002227E3BD
MRTNYTSHKRQSDMCFLNGSLISINAIKINDDLERAVPDGNIFLQRCSDMPSPKGHFNIEGLSEFADRLIVGGDAEPLQRNNKHPCFLADLCT